jgi:hypothetical protein
VKTLNFGSLPEIYMAEWHENFEVGVVAVMPVALSHLAQGMGFKVACITAQVRLHPFS